MNLFSGDHSGILPEKPNQLSEEDASLSERQIPLSEKHASSSEEQISLSGESVVLPGELAKLYEIQSCLNYSEQSVTCLLRERSTGRLCLMKAAADPMYANLLRNERNMLTFIHNSDNTRIGNTFSNPLYLGEHAGTTYYIRSYIEGSTLEELCDSGYHRPGLEPSQALNYMIALTELLQFLHSLEPPLIHRDIKPQNVIVDPVGNCHFIDLGISRFFQPEKDTDTFIMGTRLTAPPEQFGYRQTDTRSDLYSMGVLLYYCITGEYEISDQAPEGFPAELWLIVRKATMFDPGKRYQTAAELLAELLSARYPSVLSLRSPRPGKGRRIYLTSLAILGALCVTLTAILTGSFLRNRIPENPVQTGSEIYTFTEPLIEEAVRLQLNLPEGNVTAADLARIDKLHIFGLQIYGSDDELHLRCDSPWFFDNDVRESGEYLKTGSITSLEDIRHMPNLTSLSLYGQQISDISALKGLPVRELGLGWNPLTDLEPLRGNESIRYLCLSDLKISDASVLGTLPNLSTLKISGTKITSLEALSGCDLESLDIYQVPLIDYGQLELFPNLHSFETNILTTDIVAHLAKLPLTDLFSAFSSIRSMNDLSVLSDLESLRLGGDDSVFTFDNPQLEHLRSAILDWMVIPDFHGTASLKALSALMISNADCQSYDGLDELTALQEITCTPEQRAAICAQYPDNTYLFH